MIDDDLQWQRREQGDWRRQHAHQQDDAELPPVRPRPSERFRVQREDREARRERIHRAPLRFVVATRAPRSGLGLHLRQKHVDCVRINTVLMTREYDTCTIPSASPAESDSSVAYS